MSRHRTVIRLSAVLAAVALAKGCGDGDSPTPPPTPEPARPTTVTVSPATAELTALGATVQLTAEVRDQNGQVMTGPGAAAAWSSSSVAVATVNASGLVTAAGPGTATITATAGGVLSSVVSGSAMVTVVAPPPSDRAILVALYDATGGPNWTISRNWLTDAPLGDWHGVGTDGEERVIELVLEKNGLKGRIPPEMGHLGSVRRLRFLGNELTGPIPPELGGLANLEELWLHGNPLAGTIPPELGDLVSLRVFTLGGYVPSGLRGSIPPELGRLANLERLSLFWTELTGPIPTELGDLANLRELALNGNELTGSIPSELGGLANLWRLSLGDNELSGSIPPQLGGLGGLRELSLALNVLSGPIPPELGNLATLEELDLSDNALTGPIPPELGDLARLTALRLQDNVLTGPVPSEFGALTDLQALLLRGNAGMSGALPLSLTRLRSLETLHTAQTDLCAPSDAGFLQWLEGVPSRRVARCGGSSTRAYLVQAVQSREFPVPLVAGREVLLRVFVTALRDNDVRIPPVRASFYLDGVLSHVEDLPGKQGPVPTGVVEESLASTTNAVIASELVRPGLEMVVEIDPDGTLAPELGVATRIPETGRLALDVRSMPVLDLTLVPFLLAEAPDSEVLSAVQGVADDPAGHELLRHIRTLLPTGGLEARVHESVLSSSNDASTLLNQTDAIRVMEGADGHYMGLMSGLPDEQGLGYIPGRSSFSVPDSRVMAHELGHNLSLYHAPGTGFFTDLNYPYSDGTIGTWGYDFRNGGELVPPEWYDVMSYGRPAWISDYHFAKALRYWQANGGASRAVAAAATGASLLLWGGTNAAGAPFLEPAFVVDAPPALPPADGEYRIVAMGTDGRELFSLGFDMPETADGDGSSSFAFVLPADSAWTGTLSTLTLSGPGGSVTLDGRTARPMAILRDPRSGQVRGFLRDPPPAAQAARDAAGQAVGPGLEVLFSRGIPDASAWRR